MLNKKALGATAAAQALYVEDVFSTYLYTGTGASQTITNNIDLSGEGGMVWIKSRSDATDNFLFDTARGTTKEINSNSTGAEATLANSLTAFNNNGFTVSSASGIGTNAATYASWTFRKAEKFFDVVTWTGDGTGDRTISHNLGATPGCIITKATSAAGTNWHVFHRSINSARYGVGYLNSSTSFVTGTSYDWNPTSTNFVADDALSNNDNGTTYVAYLFAHDAGGFGDSGSDSVIKCGSVTDTAQQVTLGWEPQWIFYKTTGTTGGWNVFDSMRGMTTDGDGNYFQFNTTSAEASASGQPAPNSTGFYWAGGTGSSVIYIAIRRGPMKTPEAGTEVFSPQTASGVQTAGFPVDAFLGVFSRTSPGSYDPNTRSRLIGVPYLVTSSTAAETGTTNVGFDSNTGLTYSWPSGNVNWYFRRAPGFFDVVCYTGTGSATTITHNLAAVPELIIVKRRNTAGYDWLTYCAYLNSGTSPQNWWVKINGNTEQFDSNAYWNDTAPTSSVFSVGTESDVNSNGATYVAYLFGSVNGVSKVGSYTGNGSNQTINCGFTGGARFVLIKRVDSTGDWVVFDSARGIVSGNDPYLELNTTDAEVTDKDAVDTNSTGFVVNETTGPNVNTNNGKYIYLAIA